MRTFFLGVLILALGGDLVCRGAPPGGFVPEAAAVDSRGGGPVLRLDAAGGRFGFGMTRHGASFHQAEGYLGCLLPWVWAPWRGWRVEAILEGACGGLRDGRQEAAIASAGPGLKVLPRGIPIFMEAGIEPTFLSFHHFTGRNLGADFQFTSHVGMGWDILPHVRVGYRFQHMSNAGFSKPNPGLNLHMFSLGHAF